MLVKKIIKLLKDKVFIISVLIVIQLIVLFTVINTLSEYFIAIYFLLVFLSVIISVYIVNKDENPSYKITWLFSIMAFPVFGGLVYLMFGGQKVPKALRERDQESQKYIQSMRSQNLKIMDELEELDPLAHKQSRYLWESVGFPVYQHTQARYFPLGDKQFPVLLEELKKAKKFIFLEFFIIAPGIMWDSILEILIEKAKEGVDVRVLYDDVGCIRTLPADYCKKLKAYGIKAKPFNPLKPHLAIQMNNRDHRKILIIDGKAAMTGGINLADEYINKKERFGHWKDCSVMLYGEAVWSFTLMFLQFWNYDETIKDDYLLFKAPEAELKKFKNDGYVQPFSDAPTDDDNVGECMHMNIINSANRYVYATTPYLIIDNEMKTSLVLAAKNGVDVRIIVPHIPDKRYAFQLTRSNYKYLIQSGVRIFEYTPGFVHAKNFVADDKVAFVGTVNMDYRSYYLHYECGVWFYKNKVVDQVKEDYLDTLQKCQEITLEDCLKVKLPIRILRAFMGLFAPLM